MIGEKRKFAYPAAFVALEDYSAHRGQIVTVRRELQEGIEYDNQGERMFEIAADDGWVGHAYESELEPV